MNERSMKSKETQGQAIVIMVFAIIAMAALVGLAIDGGQLYTIRRQAQNAADASAMAGTRELAVFISDCTPQLNTDSRVVYDKVMEFVQENGLDPSSANVAVEPIYVRVQGEQTVSVGPVSDSGPIPTGAAGVYVRVVATDTTTFMNLFGVNEISAPAEATAMAGPIKTFGGGQLPIAVPLSAVYEIDPGDSFLIKGNGDMCEIQSCDPDSENYPQSQRGWLQMGHIFNMGYTSGDLYRVYTGSYGGQKCDLKKVSPLESHIGDLGVDGWVHPDCAYPRPVFAGPIGELGGDFIAGITGENAAALNIMQGHYKPGDRMVMPIFDYIYTGACKSDEVCMDTVFDGQTPHVNWMTGKSAYYYHIVGFVTVELEGITHSSKEIQGRFVSAVYLGDEIDPSSGIGGGCVQSVIGVAMWD